MVPRRPNDSSWALFRTGVLGIVGKGALYAVLGGSAGPRIVDAGLFDLVFWQGMRSISNAAWLLLLWGVSKRLMAVGIGSTAPDGPFLKPVLHTALMTLSVVGTFALILFAVGLLSFGGEGPYTSGGGLAFTILVYIPLDACVQELFCRGVLLQLMCLGGLRPHIANFIQSVAFSLGHWPSGLPLISIFILFGFIMGWSVLRNKTLIPAMIVHSTGNVVAWLTGLI